MIGSTSHDGPHLRWPAERFYWAILESPDVSLGRVLQTRRAIQRLGYLFESALPGEAIEQIQAVYQRLPGHSRRFVACGVPTQLLEREVDQSALTLSPQSMPSFVDASIDPARLNLLTGPFLPKAVQHLRRRWLLHVCVIATLCASLLVLGLERRVGLHRRAGDDLVAAQNTTIRQVLGTSVPFPGAGAELRLTAERRRLEQTRSDDITVTDVSSASTILARLLALWPQNLHAQTRSLSITARSITLRATVPTMADAQTLADAVAPLEGWRLQQPQSEARRDQVDVTLRFVTDPEQVTQ